MWPVRWALEAEGMRTKAGPSLTAMLTLIVKMAVGALLVLTFIAVLLLPASAASPESFYPTGEDAKGGGVSLTGCTNSWDCVDEVVADTTTYLMPPPNTLQQLSTPTPEIPTASPIPTQPPTPTPAPLGLLTITIGQDGALYGFDDRVADYGGVSGDFPDGLFNDSNSRTASAIYEDADGYWWLYYSGGTRDDWIDDEASRTSIVLTVNYANAQATPMPEDRRRFVLAGFMQEEDYNGLRLDPPIPGRDWNQREGWTATLDFSRHAPPVGPDGSRRVTEDPTREGSLIHWLFDVTPGGPVTLQALVTIIVYVLYMRSAPRRQEYTLMAAIVLAVTPWWTLLFGAGTIMGPFLVGLNVVLGAFGWRAWVSRMEG